jgi:uncharacterized protein DUF429
MLSSQSVYVGVDTTSGHKAFTYAAFDRDLNVLSVSEAELDELLAFLAAQPAAIVAINSPSHLNTGLVRKSLRAEIQAKRGAGRQQAASQKLRGVELRVAEHELRERGILVGGTASRESLCPPWVQIGLELYHKLGDMDFQPYPAEDCPRQWLETHPHAAYCALLGRVPFSKPSLEGRLQRELVLFEHGLRIRDPLLFFEEITRHKLLGGVLPMELLYPTEHLDALVAAYTAWLSVNKPAEVTRLGSGAEGFIHLPAGELKEKYQA